MPNRTRGQFEGERQCVVGLRVVEGNSSVGGLWARRLGVSLLGNGAGTTSWRSVAEATHACVCCLFVWFVRVVCCWPVLFEMCVYVYVKIAIATCAIARHFESVSV